MEPLDPKLARLVHDGMVQAVPGPEVEDRVLLGLIARLPRGGPPQGDGNGDGMPHGSEGLSAAGTAAAAGTAGATGAATATKAWVLAAVLGAAAAVTGGVVLGGRRDAEPAGTRDGKAAATRVEVAAKARPVTPSGSENAPKPQPQVMLPVPDPARAPTSTPAPSSANERNPRRASTPRPPTSTTEPALSSDDLAAEIQEIAAADRALARGELRQALLLAREHATAHPHGQLGLERTAIELGARCQLGEAGAAAAAATFLREHADAPAAAKVRTRCAAEPTE